MFDKLQELPFVAYVAHVISFTLFMCFQVSSQCMVVGMAFATNITYEFSGMIKTMVFQKSTISKSFLTYFAPV